MKLTPLFFLFVTAYYVASAKPKTENFEGGVRFRSAKCWTDSSMAILKACSLKAYSRRTVGLSIAIDFPKPLEKPFYIQALLKIRTGQTYHTIVDTKQVEWCGIMDGSAKDTFLMYITSLIKDSAPTLFHKCPYTTIDVKNMTIDISGADDTKWVPPGIIRLDVYMFKHHAVVLNVNTTLELKDSRDDSFKADTFIKRYV
jgi:hypothetical protein